MKNNILKYGLLAFLWLTLTLPALAGPDDPPDEEDPIDPVPVDEWLPYLFLAGIIIGIYHFIKKEVKMLRH